jgi:hypothetical protein
LNAVFPEWMDGAIAKLRAGRWWVCHNKLKERNILKLILIMRFACATLDLGHPMQAGIKYQEKYAATGKRAPISGKWRILVTVGRQLFIHRLFTNGDSVGVVVLSTLIQLSLNVPITSTC